MPSRPSPRCAARPPRASALLLSACAVALALATGADARAGVPDGASDGASPRVATTVGGPRAASDATARRALPPLPRARLVDEGAIRASIAARGEAALIVLLAEPTAPLAPDATRRPAVAAAQASVLASLAALPPGSWRTTHRYGLLAALAGEATAEALAALTVHPGVVSIEPDRDNVPMGRAMLGQQRPLIGADEVWRRYRLSGEGVNVAIVDTGIDAEHPDLADDLVDQRCYSGEGGCGQNNATEGPVANDEDGHGTAIAGIVTSGGVAAPLGIAPDAGIVALRVFDRRTRARTADIIAGFDWLERNRARLDVRVVNMSLGSEKTYVGNCDNDDAARAAAVKRLVQRGVTVFAASGNQGSDNAMAAPACIRDVVAVAASYDGELGRQPPEGGWGDGGCFDETTSPTTITCFSSINRNLSFVAPGAWTTVPRLGGGTAQTAGTSNASPVAAAVAALLLQADDGLRQADIVRLLEASTVEARKSGSNQGFPRVDALAAVEAMGLPTVTPAGPAPTSTPEPPTATATTVPPTSTAVPSATSPGPAPSATAAATATATAPPPTAGSRPTATVTTAPTATAPEARIFLPLTRRD